MNKVKCFIQLHKRLKYPFIMKLEYDMLDNELDKLWKECNFIEKIKIHYYLIHGH